MGKNNRIFRAIYVSLFITGVLMLIMDLVFPKNSSSDSRLSQNLSFDLNQSFSKKISVSDDESSNLFDTASNINVETDIYNVVFSTYKGNLVSLKLKEHLDLEKDPIELLDLDSAKDNFFNFTFDKLSKQNFKYSKIDDFTHEFKSTVTYNNSTYEYVKRYEFSANKEYLIKLNILFRNIDGKTLSDINEYSLLLKPDVQKFGEKDKLQYGNPVNQVIYYDNKLRYAKDKLTLIDPKWVGISSKYFEILLKKDNMGISFEKDSVNKLNLHILNESRQNENFINDTYFIYAGPKDDKYLDIFNEPSSNSFGVANFYFDRSIDRSIWYFLQFPMQLVMKIFYNVIPNWGLSIIFLTIVVRILIFPLTFKSFRATAELSKLQPKMKEIQTKHKEDSKKLNEEMSKLYKEEGVSPLGGCLPILLQLPVFFALYGLVNNFFLLKGASFVPGWINDLSIGDSVYYFGYKLPILGWTDIRILPLIMMITQLISTIISSNADLKNLGSQQKFLYFGMPIMFFFILYNMPSGLLLYWVTTNIFTIFQQSYIKRNLA